MERKLASLQIIHDISPIEGADKIEVASVLGWKVVVRKDEFKKYDKAVFIEVDAVLPEKPEFEFMKDRKYRVRTIRLKRQISQGLLFPLSILPEGQYETGMDVTAILGVTLYEPPAVGGNGSFLQGKSAGNWPFFLSKTDETRIQSEPGLLDEIKDKELYVTVKLDGTSGTYALREDKFYMCSRNFEKKQEDPSVYSRIAEKYNIEKALRDAQPTWGQVAIQGEIVGPTIQKNPLGLPEVDFFVFSLFNIDNGQYFSFEGLKKFCEEFKLNMVPVEYVGPNKYFSIDDMLKAAEGTYPNGKPREGLVFRGTTEAFSPTLRGRLSFKCINNSYLLAEKD